MQFCFFSRVKICRVALRFAEMGRLQCEDASVQQMRKVDLRNFPIPNSIFTTLEYIRHEKLQITFLVIFLFPGHVSVRQMYKFLRNRYAGIVGSFEIINNYSPKWR